MYHPGEEDDDEEETKMNPPGEQDENNQVNASQLVEEIFASVSRACESFVAALTHMSVDVACPNQSGGCDHEPVGGERGVRVKWITDPDLVIRVLKATSNKGDLIETLLSLPAWSPIVSLESVNGEQWQRMKACFTKVAQVLQPISHLGAIFETRGRELLESETVIDALKLNELSVACFYEWVFEREFGHEKFAVACQATWEWRKQLALKGVADSTVKQRTVEWCLEEIRRTPRLYDLFEEKWAEPEYFSLILQPFVISPAINQTDVVVAVKEWVQSTSATQPVTPEIIRQCDFKIAHDCRQYFEVKLS
uniref:Uncharacterized protein n=1 Tax=Phytophthora ramorum TaxID=164328 RepID=H3H2M5_PHYRM